MCEWILIYDAVGIQADEDGIPNSITVSGEVRRFIMENGRETVITECDPDSPLKVWLTTPDGRQTAAVNADFEMTRDHRPTGDWTATLLALWDENDRDKRPMVHCKTESFTVHAKCSIQNTACHTEREFQDLYCCLWVVRLEVLSANGDVIEGENSVYRDLEPGTYCVRVSQPPEIAGQDPYSYQWFQDDSIRLDQTDRSFNVRLDEERSEVRVHVSEPGCDPIPASVTLIIRQEPVSCPDRVLIHDKDISADCHDGKRISTLEGEVTNAIEGMRLKWIFGDSPSEQQLVEIRPQDIDHRHTARFTATHAYTAPGSYQVKLFVLDIDGNLAEECPHATYDLRVKACPPNDQNGDEEETEDGDGEDTINGDGDGGSLCWLALLFFSIAIIAIFVFLTFSFCVPEMLIGSFVGLIVLVIAVIFSAILCDRCRIFRALAWSIWWAIFLSGFAGTFGCPPAAIPIISILAVIQAIVKAAIDNIEGCGFPDPWDIPFCIQVNRNFGISKFKKDRSRKKDSTGCI